MHSPMARLQLFNFSEQMDATLSLCPCLYFGVNVGAMTRRQPVFFLSHGGGPWPWLDGDFRRDFDWLEASLQALPAQLPEAPRAVLAVSGHWEAEGFTVSSAARPGMVYDYYGFPEHTYAISYPAPGSPQIAARVIELGRAAGIPIAADPARGFDHGTF